MTPAFESRIGRALAAGGRPRGPVVLVVDDDDLVRECAADSVAHLGYDVIACGGGLAALQLLDERPEIGLLFTDIRMPGMDGIELAARCGDRRPGLPVVYTSGYCAAASPAPLLPKPYRLAELAAALRTALAA